MKFLYLCISILFLDLCYSQENIERNNLYQKNNILKVQVYEISYLDSSKIDSVLLYSLFYDSLGRLVEKRFDFNKNYTLYVSHKYIYDNKGGYSFSEYNPYVIYSISPKKIISKQSVFYDEILDRIDYELVEYKNQRNKIRIDYNYDSKGLLIEKTKSINGRIISKEKFIYFT